MDWFNVKKDQQKKKQVEKAEDINNVIQKAENDEIVTKRVDKIEFIGRKSKMAIEAEEAGVQGFKEDQRTVLERLNGFKVDSWLSKTKAESLDQFEQIIKDAYTKIEGEQVTDLQHIELEDLQLRFDLSLEVQKQSGYLIPDFVLTKAKTASDLSNYFETEILKGGAERRIKGDMLDISELKFTSPNISVEAPISSREKKRTYKKLLKEAKLLQESRAEKLIEESRV